MMSLPSELNHQPGCGQGIVRLKPEYSGEAFIGDGLLGTNGTKLTRQSANSTQAMRHWGKANHQTSAGGGYISMSRCPIISDTQPCTIIWREEVGGSPSTYEGIANLFPAGASHGFVIIRGPGSAGYPDLMAFTSYSTGETGGWPSAAAHTSGTETINVITLPNGLSGAGGPGLGTAAYLWQNGQYIGQITNPTPGGFGADPKNNYLGWDGADSKFTGWYSDFIFLNCVLDAEEAFRASLNPYFLFEDELSSYDYFKAPAGGTIYSVTLNESLALTETLGPSRSLSRLIEETIGLNDSILIAFQRNLSRVLTDTVALADYIISTIIQYGTIHSITLSDSVPLLDTVATAYQRNFGRLLDDSIPLADSIIALLQGRIVSRELLDIVLLDDAVQVEVVRNLLRTLLEPIGLTDSSQHFINRMQTLGENIQITDALTSAYIRQLQVLLTDNVVLSDSTIISLVTALIAAGVIVFGAEFKVIDYEPEFKYILAGFDFKDIDYGVTDE